MSHTRQRDRAIEFRTSTRSTSHDGRFPRAVAGEDYDRYARAVWPQAQRWFHAHACRTDASRLSMHEAREMLHTLASHDVARALCAQEDRLLTELMHAEWPHRSEVPTLAPSTAFTPKRGDVVPEIPSFLVGPR